MADTVIADVEAMGGERRGWDLSLLDFPAAKVTRIGSQEEPFAQTFPAIPNWHRSLILRYCRARPVQIDRRLQ